MSPDNIEKLYFEIRFGERELTGHDVSSLIEVILSISTLRDQ